MSSTYGFLSSPIAQKKFMALSALGLSGFLLIHMAGNLLLLVGAESYNRYSHALISNPFLPIAELGLVAFLVIHFGVAVKLTLRNKAAREVDYAVHAKNDKKTSLASKTLILSGLLILAFIILHLITFKYGEAYRIIYNGTEMRDLYRLVVEVFKQPGYVIWYLVSLIILGFHLNHGIGATFQSLGLFSVNDIRVKRASAAFSVLVTAGFCIQPLVLFFSGIKS